MPDLAKKLPSDSISTVQDLIAAFAARGQRLEITGDNAPYRTAWTLYRADGSVVWDESVPADRYDVAIRSFAAYLNTPAERM